jgi:hypothetical protein
MNVLRDNTDAIKTNTETSVDASKEVDLEINVEKLKSMVTSQSQNGG